MSREGRGTSATVLRLVEPAPSASRPVRGASPALRALAWALALLPPVTAVAALLSNRALLPEVADLHPVFLGDVLLASC